MCITYQNKDPNKPQSRADCVDKCIISVWRRLSNCTPSHISVRKDVNYYMNDYLCTSEHTIKQSISGKMKNACYKSCLPDCIDEEYNFEVEEIPFHSSFKNIQKGIKIHQNLRSGLRLRPHFKKKRVGSAHISLIRKFSGDVTYTHSPQMPFIEFICYVGSLAGLWLGLSVITIYEYSTRLFVFLLRINCKRLHYNTKIKPNATNIFIV